MATTAPAGRPAERERRQRGERLFFSSYTIAVALIIVAGFLPTFYLRGMIEPRAPLVPLRTDIIVHGLIATAFIMVMPLQAWLIAWGKRSWHIALGKWGFGLGVLFVASLYMVTAFSHHNTPPDLGVPAEQFSAPSVIAVGCVALLLWLAWRKRFDAQAHKRLIIGLACIAAGPGIARLPGIPPPPAAFVVVGFIMIVLALPLLAWDLVTRGKPHWATLAALGACVTLFVAPVAVGILPPLAGFVMVVPGFGWP
jgi:hypothetical protein